MSFQAYAALTIHDVKNRLATLANRAQARGDVDTVREALNAAELLTALLVCYKAENGWLGADIDAHAPIDLIEELAADSARLASLPVRMRPDVPGEVFFYDENLVRLAVNGALHNALRHAQHEVYIGARADERWLEFIVTDDGPGFPSEQLAESACPAGVSGQGTGLGLYLARLVADLHTHDGLRGVVLLHNDHGAHFTLRLPR
ncbi:ATP-binding protein [Pseudothauera nasutitermitis]|uniref:histidine kinase n=1 Tax=Pseudothauera nasutitermitis TaxID=2565930 RepID=A0A4S4B2R7_9RHOO|nr:ATP-binding protein [Pseudothauera nasutitermitis]THF66937.1 ATP-binding protein [Pseudothauera nasutitermitis]